MMRKRGPDAVVSTHGCHCMAGAKQVRPPDYPVSWMVRVSDPDYVDKGRSVINGLSEMLDPFCVCTFSGVEPSAKDGEIPGTMVPTENTGHTIPEVQSEEDRAGHRRFSSLPVCVIEQSVP